MGRPNQPHVTYVVSRWGTPTQTFVRREAQTIADNDVDVSVFSLKRPLDGSAGNQVVHLRWRRVMTGVTRSLAKQPRRSLRVLITVIRLCSFRNVAAQFSAAVLGLAWAGTCRDRPDLLHAHFGWVAGTAAWAASCVSDVPYSIVLHAFEIHTHDRIDNFTAVPIESASQIFTISEFDARLVATRWACAPAVLRMSVPASWTEDEPLGLDERVPHSIVSVGSLVPKKGHDILIRAMTHLLEDWHLVIIGEGPERQRLEQLIADLGLAGRVRLAGSLSVEQVRHQIDRARVFALACVVARSGDRDGIPVALMEAMARGTPVVTSDLGGISELVGGVGLLARPRDHEGLADGVLALNDNQLWKFQSDMGRQRISSRFATHVAAEPLTEFITSISTGLQERPHGND